MKSYFKSFPSFSLLRFNFFYFRSFVPTIFFSSSLVVSFVCSLVNIYKSSVEISSMFATIFYVSLNLLVLYWLLISPDAAHTIQPNTVRNNVQFNALNIHVIQSVCVFFFCLLSFACFLRSRSSFRRTKSVFFFDFSSDLIPVAAHH